MQTWQERNASNLNLTYEEWLKQAPDMLLTMIWLAANTGKPNTYTGNESQYYEECLIEPGN